MISRAFFHYLLAFTVLFASSFAVFHGSEHIAGEKSVAADLNLADVNGSSYHAEHKHHDSGELDSPKTSHSIESLCEACLLLSNLSAYAVGHPYSSFLAEKSQQHLLDIVHSKNQAFQTYLARAPPGNT